MKHTKGPWNLNEWTAAGMPTGEITISGPEGDEHICTMDGNEDNVANGFLIASAPDGYDCLKWTLDLFDNRAEDLYDEEGFPTEELNNLVSSIRAYFAKAEGK